MLQLCQDCVRTVRMCPHCRPREAEAICSPTASRGLKKYTLKLQMRPTPNTSTLLRVLVFWFRFGSRATSAIAIFWKCYRIPKVALYDAASLPKWQKGRFFGVFENNCFGRSDFLDMLQNPKSCTLRSSVVAEMRKKRFFLTIYEVAWMWRSLQKATCEPHFQAKFRAKRPHSSHLQFLTIIWSPKYISGTPASRGPWKMLSFIFPCINISWTFRFQWRGSNEGL